MPQQQRWTIIQGLARNKSLSAAKVRDELRLGTLSLSDLCIPEGEQGRQPRPIGQTDEIFQEIFVLSYEAPVVSEVDALLKVVPPAPVGVASQQPFMSAGMSPLNQPQPEPVILSAPVVANAVSQNPRGANAQPPPTVTPPPPSAPEPIGVRVRAPSTNDAYSYSPYGRKSKSSGGRLPLMLLLLAVAIGGAWYLWQQQQGGASLQNGSDLGLGDESSGESPLPRASSLARQAKRDPRLRSLRKNQPGAADSSGIQVLSGRAEQESSLGVTPPDAYGSLVQARSKDGQVITLGPLTFSAQELAACAEKCTLLCRDTQNGMVKVVFFREAFANRLVGKHDRVFVRGRLNGITLYPTSILP